MQCGIKNITNLSCEQLSSGHNFFFKKSLFLKLHKCKKIQIPFKKLSFFRYSSKNQLQLPVSIYTHTHRIITKSRKKERKFFYGNKKVKSWIEAGSIRRVAVSVTLSDSLSKYKFHIIYEKKKESQMK